MHCFRSEARPLTEGGRGEYFSTIPENLKKHWNVFGNGSLIVFLPFSLQIEVIYNIVPISDLAFARLNQRETKAIGQVWPVGLRRFICFAKTLAADLLANVSMSACPCPLRVLF